MLVIGTGNLGMKLATMFAEDPILISTAHQDSVNYNKYNVNTFSEDGAGKRFGSGRVIWEENYSKLKSTLNEAENEKVIVFSSLGGGSGSSSINYICDILLEKQCKILLIGVLPHRKEVNPPLANAVQSVNSIMPYISKVSVLLFNNDILLKQFNNDWRQINESIVQRVSYLIHLLDKYSLDMYSPMTLDNSELDSVVFGGGFIDVSDEFLEEKNPKFEYGKIDKDTKNLLIAMYVDKSVEKEKVDDYHGMLTTVSNKLSGRAKNARLIPGIIRGNVKQTKSEEGIKDRAYVIIASGLSVDRYLLKIEKMRDIALEKANNYSNKIKVAKIATNKDIKSLDI